MNNKTIYQVKFSFDEFNDSKANILYLTDNYLKFKDLIINYQDIDHVELLMCSIQRNTMGRFSLMSLKYYVDLNVYLDDTVYYFQIMNNDRIKEMITFIKEKVIRVDDPLSLQDIYSRFDDPVKRENYINVHFKKWAQKFHLDNPRESHFDILKKQDYFDYDAVKRFFRGE